MRTLRQRHPEEFTSLQSALNRVFHEDFFRASFPEFEGLGATLPLDVQDTGDALVVTASVPGLAPEAISIEIKENLLTIAAEQTAETEEETPKYLLRERRLGRLERTVRLPVAIDRARVSAQVKAGVLTLTLPKAEAATGHKIAIQSAE